MKATKLSSQQLRELMDRAIARSLGGGSIDREHIEAAIKAGLMQLWRKGESLVVTHVDETFEGKTLFFVLASGNMDEVQSIYRVVMRWARNEQDVKRATFIGRSGWGRTFLTREEGWRPTHTMFVKEM
jgi:hypothetical protein